MKKEYLTPTTNMALINIDELLEGGGMDVVSGSGSGDEADPGQTGESREFVWDDEEE